MDHTERREHSFPLYDHAGDGADDQSLQLGDPSIEDGGGDRSTLRPKYTYKINEEQDGKRSMACPGARMLTFGFQ